MQGDGDVGVPKMDDCPLGLPVRGHPFWFLENGLDFSAIVWVRVSSCRQHMTYCLEGLRGGEDDEILV